MTREVRPAPQGVWPVLEALLTARARSGGQGRVDTW